MTLWLEHIHRDSSTFCFTPSSPSQATTSKSSATFASHSCMAGMNFCLILPTITCLGSPPVPYGHFPPSREFGAPTSRHGSPTSHQRTKLESHLWRRGTFWEKCKLVIYSFCQFFFYVCSVRHIRSLLLLQLRLSLQASMVELMEANIYCV